MPVVAPRHCDPSGYRDELVGPRAEVDLVRRLIVEGLMQPPAIVGIEVRRELPLRFAAVTVRVQIDLLVLDRPLQPLDEYVVHPATFAVHADAAAGALQPIEPVLGSVLRALVAVENLRSPEACKCLFQGGEAEISRERVGEPPSQHLAAGDVEDGRQVQEPVGHRQTGDIGGPDLVRPFDRDALEQVQVDRPLSGRDARARLAVAGLDAHAAHERADVQAARIQALPGKLPGDASRPVVPDTSGAAHRSVA